MSFVFVVLLGIFCLFFLWPATSKAEENAEKATEVTASAVKDMSRTDVENKLRNIEKQDAPKLMASAMCYEIGAVITRNEYVCPVCGEKTLYPGSIPDIAAISKRLAELKKISTLKMELDERSFCKKCHPEAQSRTLILKITYDDGRISECRDITLPDMEILSAFFKGKLSYDNLDGIKSPLKTQLPRLRELLGIKEKEVK